MQRQAVPLMKSRAALLVLHNRRVVILVIVIAKRAGIVEQVDANKIVIRADESSYLV